MPTIRAQVILHTADNFAANYITNSFAFNGLDTLSSTTAITTALKDFYDDLGPTIMANTIATNGHEVKYYELPGLTPNYPFEEDTFNLGSAWTGTPLPSEVALCLSFQGTRAAGQPQARRRGRIYVGPFAALANNAGRPSTTTINNLTAAAATLKASIAAITGDVEWVIWSPTDGTPVLINNGWVDNVWDTQRRRGVEETSRTTWS